MWMKHKIANTRETRQTSPDPCFRFSNLFWPNKPTPEMFQSCSGAACTKSLRPVLCTGRFLSCDTLASKNCYTEIVSPRERRILNSQTAIFKTWPAKSVVHLWKIHGVKWCIYPCRFLPRHSSFLSVSWKPQQHFSDARGVWVLLSFSSCCPRQTATAAFFQSARAAIFLHTGVCISIQL